MAHSLEINENEAKHLKQEEEEDGLVCALNVIFSSMFPLAVQSAIELGIFDILAKAGEGVKLSAEDIAIKIGSKNPEAPRMLDRLLKLLSCHSMLYSSLSEHQQELYSLAPASKCFVTDANGVSMGPFLNFILDKVSLESWTGVKEAILEGGTPFHRVYRMDIYEYTGLDPRFNGVFNNAMVNYSIIAMKSILELYEGFEHVKRLVDVGGGLGMNLNLITSKYPHIEGVNLDLPHVIQHAPTYTGVTHVAGDMFQSVPNGDAIFLKWILHNWSDEQCLKLLKNCYEAIPNDGKVIVVEFILPIVPENTAIARRSFQLDLIMMTHQRGGKERTQQEFTELALGSGFRDISFTRISAFWVMEFLK